MPHMFWECNRKYSDHKLPTPKYGLLHSFRILARFEYDRRKGKADKRNAPKRTWWRCFHL